MIFQNLISKWQEFFFEPKSPLPMALFRIAIGSLVICDLVLTIWPDFSEYYGDCALIPFSDIVANWWRSDSYFDLIALLPANQIWLTTFFWLSVILAIFVTVGLFARWSSALLFLCLLSLDNHFLANQNASDTFLVIAVMIVSMSRAGDAISVDNLIAGGKPAVASFQQSAPWAQRLMQLQMAYVYFQAWLCKLSSPLWISGLACYYIVRHDDLMRLPVPFLFENLLVLKLLTWATLVVEFALFSLIWFKYLRYWVLLAALIFHLSLDWSLNLPLFQWIFISCFLLFIDAEHIEAALPWLAQKTKAKDGASIKQTDNPSAHATQSAQEDQQLVLPDQMQPALKTRRQWATEILIRPAFIRPAVIAAIFFGALLAVRPLQDRILHANQLDSLDVTEARLDADESSIWSDLEDPKTKSDAQEQSDLIALGMIYWQKRFYATAESCFQKVTNTKGQEPPSASYDHLWTQALEAQSQLSLDQSRWPDSLSDQQKLLTYDMKCPDSKDNHTARDFNTLGVTFYLVGLATQNRSRQLDLYQQSSNWLGRAIVLYEASTQREHAGLAHALANQALVLRDLGMKSLSVRASQRSDDLQSSLHRHCQMP